MDLRKNTPSHVTNGHFICCATLKDPVRHLNINLTHTLASQNPFHNRWPSSCLSTMASKRPLKSKERKSPVNSCKQGPLFTTDINVHLWWSIWDGLLFTHGIYMFKKSLCTKYMMLSHGFLTRSEYGLSTLIAQHLDSFHLVSSTFSNVHNDY